MAISYNIHFFDKRMNGFVGGKVDLDLSYYSSCKLGFSG